MYRSNIITIWPLHQLQVSSLGEVVLKTVNWYSFNKKRAQLHGSKSSLTQWNFGVNTHRIVMNSLRSIFLNSGFHGEIYCTQQNYNGSIAVRKTSRGIKPLRSKHFILHIPVTWSHQTQLKFEAENVYQMRWSSSWLSALKCHAGNQQECVRLVAVKPQIAMNSIGVIVKVVLKYLYFRKPAFHQNIYGPVQWKQGTSFLKKITQRT